MPKTMLTVLPPAGLLLFLVANPLRCVQVQKQHRLPVLFDHALSFHHLLGAPPSALTPISESPS